MAEVTKKMASLDSNESTSSLKTKTVTIDNVEYIVFLYREHGIGGSIHVVNHTKECQEVALNATKLAS